MQVYSLKLTALSNNGMQRTRFQLASRQSRSVRAADAERSVASH